jgi:hypothetical protein
MSKINVAESALKIGADHSIHCAPSASFVSNGCAKPVELIDLPPEHFGRDYRRGYFVSS